MEKFKRKLLQVLAGMVLLTLASCYPDKDISIDDLDLVITKPDKKVNFSSYKTYSLPDTVVKIVEGKGKVDQPDLLDSMMLNLVRFNLNRFGYREEINPEINTPDLLVLIALQEDDIYNHGDDHFYFFHWWYWWSYRFSKWGLGEDWTGISPSLPITFESKSRTIFILAIDPKNQDDTNKQVPIVWTAILNGLKLYNSSYQESQIKANINQAFQQSNYLKNN